MAELWDVYDSNRNKTGRITQRGENALKAGEYHIIVTGIIINSKNEILLSRRAAHKKNGLKWEFTTGSAISGETSLQGVLREIKEELGLEFNEKEAIYFKEIRKDDFPSDFKDMWIFKKDVNIKDLTFPDKEVIDAKWVSIDEFMKMKEQDEIIPHIDFGEKEYDAIKKY